MVGVIVCPNCGKRFDAKPELIGKRVRCAKCKVPFRVEEEELRGEIDLAPVAAEEPAIATPPPIMAAPLKRGGGKRAFSRGAAEVGVVRRRSAGLSERARSWLRFGGSVVVVGIVGIFLPYVGLKFKGMPDEAQQIGSLFLAGLGVLICAFAYIGRYLAFLGKPLRILLRIILGLLGALGLLMLLGRGCPGLRHTTTMNVPTIPTFKLPLPS